MRFGAAYWVQRTGWPELRAAVLRAEAAGFDDLWIDDHLLSDEGDWHDPKLEGWTTLAAIAAVTERARLGHMVVANTLRNPGLTAEMTTTLDHVSGGRMILGLGAGWLAHEHEAFGFDFGRAQGATGPPWRGRPADPAAAGRRDRHPRGPLLPVRRGRLRPTAGPGPRPHPHRRLRSEEALPMVARHADLWNTYGSPDELAASDAILRAACEAIGRDERTIERTVNVNVVIRQTRAEAEHAWADCMRTHRTQEGEDHLDAAGTVEMVADSLRRLAHAGFAHPVLVFRTPFDLETIERLPDLRAAMT